jgi:chromosome segregation ATPase
MGEPLSLRQQIEQLQLDKARMEGEIAEARASLSRESALRKQIEQLNADLMREKIERSRLEGHLDGIREQIGRVAGLPRQRPRPVSPCDLIGRRVHGGGRP